MQVILRGGVGSKESGDDWSHPALKGATRFLSLSLAPSDLNLTSDRGTGFCLEALAAVGAGGVCISVSK